MCRNMALNEKNILFGVETACHVKRKGIVGAAAKLRGILSYGDGVHIDNTIVTAVFVGKLFEILDCSEVVSERK